MTPGTHDAIDIEDIFADFPGLAPTPLQVLGALFPGAFIAALIPIAVAEHFIDVEGKTSDKGVSIGPEPPDSTNLKFEKRIDVTPLSPFTSGDNIYRRKHRTLLALCGYAGAWGAHNERKDHSSPRKNRTARYFRKFLKDGQIEEVILL